MKRHSPGGGGLLFVAICILILCSVSFYVALSNYLLDEEFNVASPQFVQASANVHRAERIEREVELSKTALGNQTQACQETRARIQEDYAELDPTFVHLFNELNATIEQMNQTCRSQIQSMQTTLIQIINMTNATSQVVNNGVCQFGTLNTTNYQYHRLSLNGLEFYFYTFSSAYSSSMPPRVHNCSPQLFKSNVKTPVLFSPEVVSVGQNALELTTQSISAGFQVWVNLF